MWSNLTLRVGLIQRTRLQGASNVQIRSDQMLDPSTVHNRTTTQHAVSPTLVLKLTEDATLGVAGSVWDGGKELACEMVGPARCGPCAGQRVVELGAGPGIAGIAAACCGAQVVLTDLGFCVELMQENIELNRGLISMSGGSATAPDVADLVGFDMEVFLARATQGHSIPYVMMRRLGDALSLEHLRVLSPFVYHVTSRGGAWGH